MRSGLTNYDLQAKSCPQTGFVDKVVLEPRQSRPVPPLENLVTHPKSQRGDLQSCGLLLDRGPGSVLLTLHLSDGLTPSIGEAARTLVPSEAASDDTKCYCFSGVQFGKGYQKL